MGHVACGDEEQDIVPVLRLTKLLAVLVVLVVHRTLVFRYSELMLRWLRLTALPLLCERGSGQQKRERGCQY